MSRNNTGNPLGSKAFPDFEDNVKNLDEAVNGEGSTWLDRLGKKRKGLAGMEGEFEVDQAVRADRFDSEQSSREHRFNELLQSSGYQLLGDYAAGIEVTEYNHVIRADGEMWRLSAQVELPYTTTGAGMPELDAFVSAGDAVLRQQLASAGGAELVLNSEGETLESRTDKTYSAVSEFKPNIVAQEPGYHCAFGSIARVRYLNNIGAGNLNLVVYRRGLNHQNDGIIRGVYVTDDATSQGEPFTLASPTMFPNIGRGGVTSPNDFRDPNIVLLPDGRVLLTFFAINFEEDATRTQYESYSMIGTFDETYRTFSWTAPVIMLDFSGMLVYGKPTIVEGMVYTASYTGSWSGDRDGPYDFLVLGAPVSDITNWSVIGTPIISIPLELGSAYSEPVLRPRPGGGYFVQIRYERGGREVRRIDSDSIYGPWAEPVTIFTGSSHTKGLEFMSGGLYFTGVRYFGAEPGVAIMATEESAATPVQLHVAGVVMSSYIASGEAGYVDFTSIGTEEWLGVCHTDTGETIECWKFTDAMVRNKRVKNDTVSVGRKRISAAFLDPLMHTGYGAARSFNLIENPLLKVPYGFSFAPGWSGQALSTSDGTEIDGPGPGFAKLSSFGGALVYRFPLAVSRVFQREAVAGAARIFCLSPNRIRLGFSYGNTVY